MATVELAKAELTLNQPTYVGAAILDVSKTLIFATVTPRESTQTRGCYLLIQVPPRIKVKWIKCKKSFILISICSIFLDTRKTVDSMMMKTKN